MLNAGLVLFIFLKYSILFSKIEWSKTKFPFAMHNNIMDLEVSDKTKDDPSTADRTLMQNRK